ncbi:MAG: ferredoxin--nitrite reductase, partial [Elusimicrobia bacterium]|nr:ferredoxin--nitrite reductase [Elusimicrobiota bacterium]
MFIPGANPIEKYKSEKDGFDILQEIETIAANGYAQIAPGDVERLKWIGTFLRKRTPGFFMMRIRITGGQTNSRQMRALAGISERLGNNIMDVTTRQQIELRAIKIESVPQILKELKEIDLSSFQTGMDNIRGVNTCPLSGLTPHEILDAYPYTVEFTNLFLKNKEFTNLPRKMNVTFTGCLENCTHPESQDIGLVPAKKDGKAGFNVSVGGKMGSGGFCNSRNLDVFVTAKDAAPLSAEIALLFRDHGLRGERTKCRLAFLLESWGMDKFRSELDARWFSKTGEHMRPAGQDLRRETETDHLGVTPQKQPGLYAVGLKIPVGRITAKQMQELARLSESYGSGELRITPQQNMVLINIPKEKLNGLMEEPLLTHLTPEPTPLSRKMVSCVGTDYCNIALIETKGIALK